MRTIPASIRCLSDENRAALCAYQVRATDRLRIELNVTGREYMLTVTSVLGGIPSEDACRWPQSLPERKQTNYFTVDKQEWLVPVVDTVALSIYLAWPEDQIEFADDRAELSYNNLIAMIRNGDFVAMIQAEFKARPPRERIAPPHNFETHPELQLMPHQHAELVCSMYNPAYSYFAKQGTGKTAPTIARICNEAAQKQFASGEPYLAIVVCPKAVRLNWQLEIERFATQKIRVTRIDGTDLQCIKLLVKATAPGDHAASVVIIGFDKLRTIGPAIPLIRWDLMVVDEGHNACNVKTHRFKNLCKLRDNSDQVLVLTGTPVRNSPIDLFALLEIMRRGGSGFSSYKNFNKFFRGFKSTESGIEAILGFKNIPILKERLARMSFIVTKEEALPDLPAKVYDVIECELSEEQRDVYNKVTTQLAAEIESDLDRAENGEPQTRVLIANNILTRMLKLAQITAGFINFGEIRDETGEIVQQAHTDRFDPNPKLEMLVEMLKERESGEKSLIWSTFKEPIRTIRARLELEGIQCVTYYGETDDDDRAEAVRRFNEDDNCTVFIGNQRSGGVGLNLVGHPIGVKDYHTWCAEEWFFAQGWSWADREQAEDRAHRHGAYGTVRIRDLIVPGTIDTEIRSRVLEKRDMSLKLADIRNLLHKIVSQTTEDGNDAS